MNGTFGALMSCEIAVLHKAPLLPDSMMLPYGKRQRKRVTRRSRS